MVNEDDWHFKLNFFEEERAMWFILHEVKKSFRKGQQELIISKEKNIKTYNLLNKFIFDRNHVACANKFCENRNTKWIKNYLGLKLIISDDNENPPKFIKLSWAHLIDDWLIMSNLIIGLLFFSGTQS